MEAAEVTVAVLLIAYLIGAIPFSLLVALLARGVDLRRAGSGNPGGMNAARLVGWGPGLLAMALDAGKGIAAVAVAHGLDGGESLPALAAAAAVLGHCYSLPLILLYVRETAWASEARLSWWVAQPRLGGKGMATGIGALLVLSPRALAGAAAVFSLTVLLLRWRRVQGTVAVARSASLAISAVPLLLWWSEHSPVLTAAGTAMALVTLLKHVPYLALGPKWPEARPTPQARGPSPAEPPR